jgi:hypothetical protein
MLWKKRRSAGRSVRPQLTCVDDILSLVARSGGLYKTEEGSALLQDPHLVAAERHGLVKIGFSETCVSVTFSERGAILAMVTEARNRLDKANGRRSVLAWVDKDINHDR